MALSLAACGGETDKPSEAVTMLDVTTEQGISLKLPSDMIKQEGKVDVAYYVNTATGDGATFGVAEATQPITEWKEEDVLAIYQSKYEDVVVKSFETDQQINGKEALVSKLTLTTPEGNAITMVLVIVADGTKNYIVSFLHGSDKTYGSLAKNLQACIDSIVIK